MVVIFDYSSIAPADLNQAFSPLCVSGETSNNFLRAIGASPCRTADLGGGFVLYAGSKDHTEERAQRNCLKESLFMFLSLFEID